MTKLHSELGDNNGLCEMCHDKKTEYQTQTNVDVLLAGFGPGGLPAMGTMWMCPKCLKEKQARDEKTK